MDLWVGKATTARSYAAAVRTRTELVYPDHLKYDLTQKQPYAALFERLKRFLLTPDTVLLTIGFSFRDAHICAVLGEALAMNANAAVIALQFQALNVKKNRHVSSPSNTQTSRSTRATQL